jgi:hypothetical protein
MNEVLFNQRLQESRLTSSQEVFWKGEKERVLALSPEETEAELAFLEQKFLEVKAEVADYLAEKRSQKKAEAIA